MRSLRDAIILSPAPWPKRPRLNASARYAVIDIAFGSAGRAKATNGQPSNCLESCKLNFFARKTYDCD